MTPLKDLVVLEVEPETTPTGGVGERIYAFRVVLPEGSGRCYITSREAVCLRQLNCEWVLRALGNFAVRVGCDQTIASLLAEPGLQLRADDAHEGTDANESPFSERPGNRRFRPGLRWP